MKSELEVAVIGAGLAGLAAAAELAIWGHDVALFDSGSEIGGVAQSKSRSGYLIEAGPNTFRVPAAARRFLARHALLASIEAAEPESRERFLLRDGELVAVPDGPLAFARTPLLSVRGKLRMLAEFSRPRGDGRHESVAEFATRRFGREAVDRLIAPFLTGVYAGDEEALGAAAVFPRLVDAELRRGAITPGLLLDRDPQGHSLSGSWCGRGGMTGLVRALSEAVASDLYCGEHCEAIARDERTFLLHFAGREAPIRASAVVLATEAHQAAPLLRAMRPVAAELLSEITYAPIASVALGVERGTTRVPVRGFGYLVPRGEAEHTLGCLFPSQLFPGRAPENHDLLLVICGGTRHAEIPEWDDTRLRDAVLFDLERSLGVREAECLAVHRWPRAIPQPDRQHRDRVMALRSEVEGDGHLILAGGYLDGIAVSDALLSGERAARRVSAAIKQAQA